MKPLILKSVFNLLGAGALGNGLWMLFFAENWYQNIPAAIHDTGPLNTHFVHDIGLVFCIAGIALLWCAQNIYRSYLVLLAPLRGMEHDRIERGESYVKDWQTLTMPTVVLNQGPIELSLRTSNSQRDQAIDFRMMTLERTD